MISGTTALVAHVGYPTHTFKSSLICNPWFEKNGVDAVVVPMGIKAEDDSDFFRSVFTLTEHGHDLTGADGQVKTVDGTDVGERFGQGTELDSGSHGFESGWSTGAPDSTGVTTRR